MFENLIELYQYRALIINLISRELKVRYRGSLFGFLWTFLNPLLQIAIYSLVFRVYMRSAIEHYAYFLFTGLLPWQWFSTSLMGGTSSISDKRALITKVKFPPQILPVTVIGSALVNFLLTLPILLIMAYFEGIPLGLSVVCFPLFVLIQIVFSLGLIYITASLNVMFRDLEHILGNMLLFWFFLTPLVYSVDQIPESFRRFVLILNPMACLVQSYHEILFLHQWPSGGRLAFVSVISIALLWLGSKLMASYRESFAEFA